MPTQKHRIGRQGCNPRFLASLRESRKGSQIEEKRQYRYGMLLPEVFGLVATVARRIIMSYTRVLSLQVQIQVELEG